MLLCLNFPIFDSLCKKIDFLETLRMLPNIIITENGINKLLQNINIHKASGPDNIHGRILKECTTQIAPILTTLFSLSLKTGKIPDECLL
jgi:hypothetical protein